jgi:hypothetical protein
VPIHHSLPGASNVIYLDFTGMTITGTAWNDNYGGGTFQALPYDLDGNSSWFSSAERVAMSRIWNRVAEDYAPFNVDVTTEPPASFTDSTCRLLVTRNSDASGRLMPESQAGGVAYVGIFGESING